MFIYSVVALFVLPSIGKLLNYNDQMYGILAGAAVNDTASVVATSSSWSEEALKIGAVVKLVRTLFIVPVTLGVIAYKIRNTSSNNKTKNKENNKGVKQIISLVPGFVVLFILAVLLATFVNISPKISYYIKTISSYMMTLALVVIGLGVHINDIKKAGLKPVILAGISWISVLGLTIVLIGILY